jgi:hypothetical protein
MVPRKNKTWGIFLIIGLALHAATEYFTDLSDRMRHGLLMLIGVVSPIIINSHFADQLDK